MFAAVPPDKADRSGVLVIGKEIGVLGAEVVDVGPVAAVFEEDVKHVSDIALIGGGGFF